MNCSVYALESLVFPSFRAHNYPLSFGVGCQQPMANKFRVGEAGARGNETCGNGKFSTRWKMAFKWNLMLKLRRNERFYCHLSETMFRLYARRVRDRPTGRHGDINKIYLDKTRSKAINISFWVRLMLHSRGRIVNEKHQKNSKWNIFENCCFSWRLHRMWRVELRLSSKLISAIIRNFCPCKFSSRATHLAISL